MKIKALFATLVLFFAVNAHAQIIPDWEISTELSRLPPRNQMHDSDTSYLALWNEVDSLAKINFTKKAAEKVAEINALARRDKNYPQVIKTLIIELALDKELKENNLWNQLQKLDAEIVLMPQPHKAVLQSMAGSAWLNALSRRSYYDDEFIEPDTNDPANWPIEEVLKRAESYLIASVQNRDELLKISVLDYTAMVDNPENAERFSPTLYDVLMWRYYEFYKAQYFDVKKRDTTALNADVLFADVTAFINFRFENTTQWAYRQKALTVLQTLLQRYSQAELTDALAMADIERIEFATNSFETPDKALLRLDWYEKQLKKYATHRIVPEFLYRAASTLQCEKTYSFYGYNGNVADVPCNNTKALGYCQTAIDNFPNEPATNNCREIKNSIIKRSLILETEKTNAAEKPFRINISYKNTQQVYIKYIAIDDDSLKAIRNRTYNMGEEADAFLLKSLSAYPIAAEDNVALPVGEDYRHRTAEWYCTGLPAGHYVMAFSSESTFPDTAIVGYATLWSTDYVLYTTRLTTNKYRIFVATAKDNTPLKGAKVLINVPDNDGEETVWKTVAEGETEKDGGFEVTLTESYWMADIGVYKNGKKILSNTNGVYLDNYNYNRNSNNPFATPETHFITDRNIYRPGQRVYFKGYMIIPTENAKPAINRQATVALEDANGEEVASQNFTSNDFGTYSGSFVIPYGRITGYYTLSDKNGSISFRVEEYKRPKFKVEMDTVKGSPSFNDTVTVTGRAIAYAGNTLNGAKLVYKVTWEDYAYHKGWFTDSEDPIQIKTGTLVLDAEGGYAITFVTRPGKDKNDDCRYVIDVDVTDITGETQSGSTRLDVGATTVFAQIEMGNRVFANKTLPITLSADDLNNVQVPLKGQLTITEIKADRSVKTELFWNRPDSQLIPQKILDKYFKNQKYGDAVETEEKGNIIFTKEITNPAGRETVEWDAGKTPQGEYEVLFEYLDNLGEKQHVSQRFMVINPKGKQAFIKNVLDVVAVNDKAQPGETVDVILSCQAPKTRVIYYIERKGKLPEQHDIILKNNLHTLKIPVTEADRGNIKITAITVYNNRLYERNDFIHVPYTNKELTVEVKTYRDKMVPGNKEEWQLKISGPDAQKVSAEIVASMYDASLDAFTQNRWPDFLYDYKPSLWSLINPRQYSISKSWGSLLYDYQQTYIEPSFQYQNSLRNFKWFSDRLVHTVNRVWSFGNAEGGSGFGRGGGGPAEGALMEARLSNANTVEKKAYAFDASDKARAYQVNVGPNEAHAGQGDALGVSFGQFIKIRRNLDETAFFFPHLLTDDSGTVTLKFIAPDALTSWNFRAFAYTKDLSSGFISLSSVTQKPLMVQPSLPRFLREGDEIYITTKVVNLSDKVLNPTVTLEIFNAATGKNIKEFNNTNAIQIPQMAIGTSEAVKWKITVPKGYGALKFIIKAYDGSFTDAEANTLPVLSDEVLVTEALPMPFSGNQPKTYELKKLTQSGQSTTLRNHKLTVEFTSNPAWYAIQALPYLMEYPYECAEQVFNRLYANNLSYFIANKNPAIRNVFDSWKIAAANGNEDSFLSNLEKNPELKSLLLEETPWMTQGKTETDRKQRLGLLFDESGMKNAINVTAEKLATLRYGNGAYPWFAGMAANRHITQYIVAGIGKLKTIKGNLETLQGLEVTSSLGYIHREAQREYLRLKDGKINLQKNHLSFDQVQYLYAISYFDGDFEDEDRWQYDSAIIFWQKQAADYWPGRSRMEQAMIALALHRLGDKKTPKIIVESMRQTAIKNADNGMYWKEMTGGYGWTDAPVETQALIIEAFTEIDHDSNSANEMRRWLLKQKQLNDWKTTRATADACYALLLNGDEWLQTEPTTTITVGTQIIDTENDPEINVEAGTGYFKKSFEGPTITPEMGKITVTPKNGQNVNMAWGGMYWQYFEKLDKITRAQTPLSIVKQLFIEKNTDSGTVKTQLKAGDKLKTGDKLVVRIYLKVNNDMDFVMLKDMRAATLEPVDFLSGYKWQNGVGYYQSIRDASMNFFFDRLPKGQWVFEYDLRVSQAGTFQNGIAAVQSMYAPEYTSHSEGIVIEVAP